MALSKVDGAYKPFLHQVTPGRAKQTRAPFLSFAATQAGKIQSLLASLRRRHLAEKPPFRARIAPIRVVCVVVLHWAAALKDPPTFAF